MTYTLLNNDGSTIVTITQLETSPLVSILDYENSDITNSSRFDLEDVSKSIFSLSMDDSGNVLAVGVPFTTTSKGYVNIYRRGNNTWELHTTLQYNSDITNTFGYSIDMTPDGGLIIIGIPTYGSNTDGVAHVYGYVNNVYVLLKVLKNNSNGTNYGSLVHIDETGTKYTILTKEMVDLINDGLTNVEDAPQVLDEEPLRRTDGTWGKTSNNINFVISAFNDIVTMDVCANLFDLTEEDFSRFDIEEADIAVIYEISLESMKNTFSFITDSSDIDGGQIIDGHTNENTDLDIIYDICSDSFPIINFAHASTKIPSNYENSSFLSNLTDEPYGVHYMLKRSLLKHEYIRYLSASLFNTIHGVDLFKNEQEVKNNLVVLGNNVLNNIKTDLSNANLNSNLDKESSNIGREIILQIMKNDRNRFSNLTISENGSIQFPFKENDTFIFNVSIEAPNKQNELTGVNKIPIRTYRIILVLKENPKNIVPNDLIDINGDLVNNVDYKENPINLTIPSNTYPAS